MDNLKGSLHTALTINDSEGTVVTELNLHSDHFNSQHVDLITTVLTNVIQHILSGEFEANIEKVQTPVSRLIEQSKKNRLGFHD